MPGALVAVVTGWAAMPSMAAISAVALASLGAHSTMTTGGVGGALVIIGGCVTEYAGSVFSRSPPPLGSSSSRRANCRCRKGSKAEQEQPQTREFCERPGLDLVRKRTNMRAVPRV